MALAVLLAAAALWAAPSEKARDRDTVHTEELTIRGKAPAGPPVRVPPPAPDKPIIDEVVESLDVYQREHTPQAPEFRLPGGPKRLSRPFPEPPYLVFSPKSFVQPYEKWRFEVFQGKELVFKSEGRGRLEDDIKWDGTDSSGRAVIRVAVPYHFSFTGTLAGEDSTLTSEPIELGSLLVTEGLGERRLEVGTALLFGTKKAKVLDSGLSYLNEVANWMRRLDPKDGGYELTLYARNVEDPLVAKRVLALRRYFSRSLLVHFDRMKIEVADGFERGDALSCRLPPSGGEVIRTFKSR